MRVACLVYILIKQYKDRLIPRTRGNDFTYLAAGSSDHLTKYHFALEELIFLLLDNRGQKIKTLGTETRCRSSTVIVTSPREVTKRSHPGNAGDPVSNPI